MSRVFIPSPQQAAVFAHIDNPNGGNAIVEAVAGAGKTTTIVNGCERMTGSVFLGAYNTKMGKELKERTSHLNNVRAGTFHSAGMNALRRFIDIKGDPDGNKVLNCIDAWMTEKGRSELEPIAKTVASCVSMAKQRGIGILFADTDEVWLDMIYHFGLDEDLPEEFEDRMDIVLKLSRVILQRSNKRAKEDGYIDFDDMIYLPLLWNLRLFQNDWLLIDEAQDTNPTRRALARKMLKPRGRLIAVGDPRQAIYGFSGADNDALAQIERDFNCKTLPLTVTYRCPKAVVKVAQQFVSHIEAHETAPEGSYKSMDYRTAQETFVAGDMILCRYNKYLVSLAFKLIREGKPARIEGRAIGAGLLALANKWKTNSLDTLVTRVTKWRDREVAKAEKEKRELRAEQIADRAETLLVLIERAQEQGATDKKGLVSLVNEMFDDRVVDNKNMITLCSAHRSKGLEFPRVYVLGLYELMGRECSQEWQTVQEINLQYVVSTRAQEELIDVYGVKEEKKAHNLEGEV